MPGRMADDPLAAHAPGQIPYFQSGPIKKLSCIGLLCLPSIFALVQIARAVLFGVIAYGRALDREMIFRWADLNAVMTLLVHVLVGLFVPGGILIGLWATRHDKY
jgi:hypothetical protein